MKRSKFSLSNYKLATFDMGQLIPVGLVEVLPGDTFQHNVSALLRCSPLVAPVMHPVDVCVHNWFVPHRIVWDGWEDFITGVDESGFPLATQTVAAGDLYDYFGMGLGSTGVVAINKLPVYGYNKIWNEFYRDQDLQTEAAEGDQAVKRVCWNKDYFTTSRPWPAKGTAVTVPLKGKAFVERSPDDGSAPPITGPVTYSDHATLLSANATGVGDYVDLTANLELQGYDSGNPSAAGAPRIDIDDLREAFALQRYNEARARYGSRYTEYLAYLGVRSGDARLQRPEYLGGGKSTISFSEVLQTGPDGAGDGVGNMLGHGITAFKSPRYRKFFSEHGYVFSLMFVRPKSMYVSGTPRQFLKTQRNLFWQKELEHIGQQPVATMELFNNNTGTFGYQDRYDEYRRQWSSVSGEFKSTLNFWHMGRIFASAPTLNEDFVECEPSKRNFASTDTNSLYAMVYHKLVARRLVSGGATPFVR